VKNTPSLLKNPKLTKTYDRDRWIQEAYDKNHSESARESRKNVLSRLDHYCNKVHEMKPEKVFEWIKKESDSPETQTQIAIDFLSQYVKFCQKDHKDIIISKGRNVNGKEKNLNKNNYLHKLHDNSIGGNIARSRGFMSQVGGIRLHNDDFKRIPIPTVVKKGMYDDEDTEPLTAEQARNVIGRTRDHRSITLYHFMNDTGFRISEAGMVVDSDFDLEANPPTVKVPAVSIKGVKSKGVRFLRKHTAILVRTLLENDDHFTFRKSNEQDLTAFRRAELKKIKHVYEDLGMDDIYEDTGRRKYNLHSWRKRCATEYARSNNESMADGYLRHSKYLAQYHLKSKEERIEAFRRAEIDLAIDEIDKEKARTAEEKGKRARLEKEKNESVREAVFEVFSKMTPEEVKKQMVNFQK
jgi:hypothetical protein